MSCTIADCRCFHKRMHEVIWSNHNLTISYGPIKLQLMASLLLTSSTLFLFLLFLLWFSVQQYCQYFASYIPVFQSEKPNQLIKIPACKTIVARERRPVSPTLALTLFWGLAQAQRHRELQRPLMCTGWCWEWALKRATVERDNRWQHLEP